MAPVSAKYPPEDLLRHNAWLRRLARGLVGQLADAEDLVQDVWLAAVDAPPDGARSPRPWLLAVARNAARGRFRSRERRVQREARSAELAGGNPTPADLIAQAETHRMLHDFVLAIDEPFRTTLLLRYYEDLPLAEIARRLRVPEGTVRWRHKRGLDLVRDRLDETAHGDRAQWLGALIPFVGKGLAVKTSFKVSTIAVVLLLALAGGVGLWYWRSGASGEVRSGPAAPSAATPARSADRISGPLPLPDRTGNDRPLRRYPDVVGDLRLEGQVIDEGEDGVGGAVVAIDSVPPREVTTEQDGSFVIDQLASREYGVLARTENQVAGPVRARLTATSEPLILRLAAGAVVEITVTDAGTELPIAGAQIELIGTERRSATTGADGRANVAALARRTYQLVIAHAGYEPSTTFLATVGQAGKTQQVRRALRAGAPVQGMVVDEAGQPVPAARVVAQSAARMIDGPDGFEGVASDGAGRWRMDAIGSGTFRFLASHDEYAPAASEPVWLDGVTERRDVRIVMGRGGRVIGSVVDAAGEFVAGAQVRVDVPTESERGAVRETFSDQRGAFAVGGLPLREVNVAAFSNQGSSATVATMPSDGEGAKPVLLRIASGAVIAGVVVDQSGEPVAEAQVMAMPNRTADRGGASMVRLRGTVRDVSDAGGRFRLPGLTAATYRLYAAPPGSPSDSAMLRDPVIARPGDEQVKLEVSTGRRLYGRVHFADGSAPKSFSAQLPPLDPWMFGDDGRFELWHVPPGQHMLRIRGAGFVDKEIAELVVRADRDTDVGDLELVRGRTISGRVVDGDGRPVGGAAVYVGRELYFDGVGLAEGRQLQRAVAAADGSYVLGGVSAGPALLGADHGEHGRSETQAVAPGSADLRYDLTLLPTGALEGSVTLNGSPTEALVGMRLVGAENAAVVVDTGPNGRYRIDRAPVGAALAFANLPAGQDLGGGGESTSRPVRIEPGVSQVVDFAFTRGAVAVTMRIRSPGDAVQYGFAVLAAGDFAAATTIAQMRAALTRGGAGEVKEGAIVADRQIRFAGVVPGNYTACVAPLPGDPNDPAVLARLGDSAVDYPVHCIAAVIAAAPLAQEVVVDVRMPQQ